LTGSLQARHQLWFCGNLVERLALLREKSVLEAGEYQALEESARLLRTIEHVVRLVTGRTRKWLPVADHPRRAAQKLLWTLLAAEASSVHNSFCAARRG